MGGSGEAGLRADDILWVILSLVPPGYVTTYSSLARALGLSPREVGFLLSRNTRPIVVPCHRVVRSDLSLGGYRFGGERVKRALLEVEGVEFDSRGRVKSRHVIDVGGYLLGSEG